MNRNSRRSYTSRAWLGLMYALTVLALIPLGLVLWFTIAKGLPSVIHPQFFFNVCLLYTSDAADDMQSVDLGGRRIIKKK